MSRIVAAFLITRVGANALVARAAHNDQVRLRKSLAHEINALPC